jgi:hypothetical protein
MMEPNRRIALMGVVMATLLLSGISVRAERLPRIELLRAIAVAGTRISLADLLPATAPESLRAQAAEISLGSAPQPGNTRILDGDAIERSVNADHQDLLSQIAVPARMVISRGARSITLAEVFAAIRAALKQSGVPAGDAVRPEDILFQSQVFVSPGDSGLQVMRMEFDRGLHRARFLLWPSHDPKVLPFFVTARLAGELPLAPVHSTIESGPLVEHDSAPVVSPEITAAPILVTRGERATLVLTSEALRMYVDVISLDSGTLGQQIQVRTDAGKVFSAQVDGRAHLAVKF